ncbi:Peroxisomal membrane signal receptor PTS1 [Boothiomyces sp. JEL0838]|nr:Peroxisomal membrane signal receptor PTS1 [Boothiomyces sp. JEL0838]
MTEKGSSIQKLTNQVLNPNIPQSSFQQQRSEISQRDHQEFLQQNGIQYEMDMKMNMTNPNLINGPMMPRQEWADEFKQMPIQERPGERPMEWASEFQKEDWSQQFQRQEQDFETIFTQSQQKERQWTQEFQNLKINQDWNQEFEKIKNTPEWKAEFEKMLNPENTDWEAQFEALKGEKPQQQWLQEFENIWSTMREAQNQDWQTQFDDIFQPEVEEASISEHLEYTFEKENPYLTNPDPFKVGLDILNAHGNLAEAALAFEAAVQQNTGNDEAWRYLGIVQQENEKEIPAIAALQKAIEVNPKNLEALMNLSVSYINEGHELQAYDVLEKWLINSYPDVNIPPRVPGKEHERLTLWFLDVIKQTAKSKFDANLQIGLGLLFYGVQEFDKTVDCFSSALSIRPDDYILWNRLGATLSNSGQSEAAIDAYYKALQLNPGFVRARYNLGVACLNIGCYKEGTEHFLGALAIQGKGDINQSATIWDTLRRSLRLMDRHDLAEKVDERDLSIFRKEFEFDY